MAYERTIRPGDAVGFAVGLGVGMGVGRGVGRVVAAGVAVGAGVRAGPAVSVALGFSVAFAVSCGAFVGGAAAVVPVGVATATVVDDGGVEDESPGDSETVAEALGTAPGVADDGEAGVPGAVAADVEADGLEPGGWDDADARALEPAGAAEHADANMATTTSLASSLPPVKSGSSPPAG